MAAKKKKTLKDYLQVGNISAGLVLKNLPYVLFLGFLLVVYIANTHYAEKKVRQIQKMESQVKELRWHYISLKTELMYKSKRSEVVRDVKSDGLRPVKGKPKKIEVAMND